MNIPREDTIYKLIVDLRKLDIYQTMLNIMKEAGWKDISSKPSTDYQVLHSTGEDDNQDLYIQLMEGYQSYVATTGLSTTQYSYFSLRSLTKYTPGEDNVAGAVLPVINTWYTASISNKDRYPKHKFDMYYHANKDRGIFFFEDSATRETCYVYMGKPRPTYNKTYANQGTIIAYNNGRTLNSTVGEADSILKNHYTINLITTAAETSLDASRKMMVHEVGWESPKTGFMGYFDGIYQVFNETGKYKASTGDIVIVGRREYRWMKLGASYNASGWHNNNSVMQNILIRIK